MLKDTTQWRQWGSNPRLLGLEKSTLPLSHCVPSQHPVDMTRKLSQSYTSQNKLSYSQLVTQAYQDSHLRVRRFFILKKKEEVLFRLKRRRTQIGIHYYSRLWFSKATKFCRVEANLGLVLHTDREMLYRHL